MKTMTPGTIETMVRAMIAPGYARDAAGCSLSPAQWNGVEKRLDAHRLAPLAHYNLHRDAELAALVPRALASRLEERARQGVTDWLFEQQAIAAHRALFDEIGCDPVLLKGPALKAFAYPEPGLRPMRDLDYLLFSTEDAIAAYERFRQAGYEPYSKAQGDPRAILERQHQLPMMISPDGDHAVELHGRLFHGNGPDPVGDAEFRARLVHRDLVGASIAFPSPEDQLVHLVHHAVNDHRFDNGPLTVSDVAFLEASSPIDEDRLAAIAKGYDMHRPLCLMRAIARSAWPSLGLPAIALEPELEAVAWSMMLATPETTGRMRSRRTFAQATDHDPRRMLARLFPSRTELESHFGPARSTLRRSVHLARHWIRLVTKRLPVLVGSRGGPMDTAYDRLDAWLTGGMDRETPREP